MSFGEDFGEDFGVTEVETELLCQDCCQDCHASSPDVVERLCPYDKDVEGVDTWVTICDACHQERADDI